MEGFYRQTERLLQLSGSEPCLSLTTSQDGHGSKRRNNYLLAILSPWLFAWIMNDEESLLDSIAEELLKPRSRVNLENSSRTFPCLSPCPSSHCPATNSFHKLASDTPKMSNSRPPRQSSGVEQDMYDEQPYADDYYRGSAQSYQNSRKGNR